MKMNKVLTTLCLSASIASASMILGFGVEADYFAPKAKGQFDYEGTKTTFDGQDDSGYTLSAYFEHPVPIIPNFKLDYTPEISFMGTNEVQFTQTDITAYYEILDNIVDLDVGITAKLLDGNIKSTALGNQDASLVLPMGYIGASLSIPVVPIRIDGDVKYISYGDNTVSDMKIKAVWKVLMGLEVTAGYRYESLKVDQSGIDSDLTISGPFAGVGYSF
jgi:outer membrane protein